MRIKSVLSNLPTFYIIDFYILIFDSRSILLFWNTQSLDYIIIFGNLKQIQKFRLYLIMIYLEYWK